MPGWSFKSNGSIPIYQSDTIVWLPGVIQGFTTRDGGVGTPPYDTLNIGLNCGDDERIVGTNRSRLASVAGVEPGKLTFAEQVHGARVAVVDSEQAVPVPGVDALVTAVPGLVLTILCADCMPIYIVEPIKRVVALIHSGWRGTAANIVANATNVLKDQFDVKPRSCHVAIGPCIGAESYEVGRDVADLFRSTLASGASTPVMPRNELAGSWNLNLRSIAFTQLLSCGYKPTSIDVCDEDTFANKRAFFSYRRESLSGLKTGRMAAFLGLSDLHR
jgi:YfiH family protein